VQVQTEKNISLEQLSYLPSFAGYILEHHLRDWVEIQLKYSRQADIPLLKLFSNFTEEEWIGFLLQTSKEYLTYLAQNKAKQQIADSIKKWKENQLPNIDRAEIVAEDITLITYVRKKTFLHFLPGYCNQPADIIDIVEEIDFFLLHSETALANTYIDLLRESINEHSHFIQQVNNTSPSAVYVFDIINFKGVYANDKLNKVFGYTQDELNKMGIRSIESLIHQDDVKVVTQHLKSMEKAADGEIKTYRYRIKNKAGGYKWIRHYESVFKRNPDGKVTQLIGTALDVDKEKRTAEQLQRREEELLEAQEIGRIGSFSWDLTGTDSKLSPQATKILEIEGGDRNAFMNQVHPDDKKNVEESIKKALEETGLFDCEYRYSGKDGEKIIWSRGMVIYKDNIPAFMNGTVMDVTDRHQILQRLQQSEKLYKQAQALGRIGNWSMDLATKKFTWSDEMYNIYELEKGKEIWEKDWESYIHPDDKKYVLAYMEDCLKNKSSYDRIHRIVLPTGKIKTIHRKAEIEYQNGIAVKLIGTSQDITEQQRVQQQLKDNQTFIQKITDAAPSVIATYNIHSGKYLFISEGIKKLLGYEVEVVVKQGVEFFINIIHPDDITKLMADNAKALDEANASPDNNNTIQEFIYRMRHKNGSYRWFQTYGTIFDRNSEGKVESILNISHDITDRITAQEKIAEQELFIQHLADASPTILYLFDVKTNSIMYVNKEIYFVLGYTTEEIIATGSGVVSQLYHPDEYELLPHRRESDRRFQQRNSMIQYECRMKSKDKEWKWLLVREIIFKADEKGIPIQILGAALDISNRKEMERSLVQNSFQLEQSNASLEEFAYVASHDLKEPLRKISTFSDRLVNSQFDKLNDEGKTYLKKIIDASQRMQTMITDLLSISMISGDRSFQKHSLNSVLDDARHALEFNIEQKNARIEADNLPEANIVPSQFRQLFQNLISNSLKFVPAEVAPVISIRSRYLTPDDVSHLQINKANRYLKLEFKDNGIGFEEEYAGKIFQIFQRLHGRSEYEGTGIGLAICKKIVEHHRGVIYASGKPGQGSVFTIILPS
jgi:PAS domain S-box-containing protein